MLAYLSEVTKSRKTVVFIVYMGSIRSNPACNILIFIFLLLRNLETIYLQKNVRSIMNKHDECPDSDVIPTPGES